MPVLVETLIWAVPRPNSAGKTPVWIFHGSADDAVPVDESRKMAEALRKLGSDFQYTEFAGVGHNAWDQAYSEPAITQWLIAARLHR